MFSLKCLVSQVNSVTCTSLKKYKTKMYPYVLFSYPVAKCCQHTIYLIPRIAWIIYKYANINLKAYKFNKIIANI